MTKYEADIIAWAKEQAAFIRVRRFGDLDIENIASELESLISDEKIHFTGLLAAYLQMLIHRKLRVTTVYKGTLSRLINIRRSQVGYELDACPSLSNYTAELMELAWGDAVVKVCKELEGTEQEGKLAGLDVDRCPWTFEQVMREGLLPV